MGRRRRMDEVRAGNEIRMLVSLTRVVDGVWKGIPDRSSTTEEDKVKSDEFNTL
jgi:hypothetical protein